MIDITPKMEKVLRKVLTSELFLQLLKEEKWDLDKHEEELLIEMLKGWQR